MVTVIIPTTARPDMLRTALASVAGQTAAGSIDCVIVSENAGDARSASVCKEFPGLPIHYIYRQPPLPALGHADALLSTPSTSAFTAILHDDDWWLPAHLEHALAALQSTPDACVYFSSFFEVISESSTLKCDSNLMMWTGAGFPKLGELWSLSPKQGLLACLAGTPGRYSTLVARSAPLAAAAHVYRLDNPFDNDRMLTIALLQVGGLVFRPIPDVCIRTHATQENRQFSLAEIHARMTGTTEWLFSRSENLGINLAGEISQSIRQCPTAHQAELLQLLGTPWCGGPLSRRGVFLGPASADRPPAWKRWLAGLTPPLVLGVWRQLRKRG